jgi:hypothetical protein
MNLFHNHAFVFDNPFTFPERMGQSKFFDGEGEFTPVRPGRHMWETNFVPDLTNFELKPWEARGAGSASIAFVLADGTMHAHTSEIPVARYKKGHRHGNGIHIFAVTGSGYSLLWYEDEQDFVHVPWRHGVLYVPELWMFHQHFNTAKAPARYLAISLGSRRYPFTKAKRDGVAGETDLDIKKGGRQVEYGDQDRRLHRKWLEEIAKTGVVSDMGAYIDERPYLNGGKPKAKIAAKPKVKAKPKAKKAPVKAKAKPKAKARVKVAATANRKPSRAKTAKGKTAKGKTAAKKAKTARRR